MRSILRWRAKIFATLMLAATGGVHAADEVGNTVALYIMDVPPMSMNEPERKGAVGDIAVEALRRAGYTSRIVVEPSPRAMHSVSTGENKLIIPLARLKVREANYTWIFPAVQVRRAFFALDKPADTFDEARARYKAVAVSRGTAGVSILRDNGFAEGQIVEVQQGDTAAKMLLAGRVDAWYNLVSESQLLLEKNDPEKKARMGEPLGSTWNYIACSRACDLNLIGRLSKALESMQQDGFVKAARKRYGFVD